MRNLKLILKAFAGAAALTTLVACEEVDPPKPEPKPISVVQPKVVTPAPAPAPPVVAKVEPPPVVDEVANDEERKPSELISDARDAMKSGELDRALELARVATKKAPKRSAAWNTLGRVQLQRGERKSAIASFETAVELNPSSSYAQNNLGLALIYDGKYDDAIDALEEATELEPVEGYMWNNLGMAYEHLDRLEEARDAYQKAADLKNGRAGENLARLQGVKTIRTAKAETRGVPVETPDAGGVN